MKSRKGGFFLIILGCCCVLAAAALYGYNSRVSAQAAEEASDLSTLLDEAMSQGTGEDPDGQDPALSQTAEATALKADTAEASAAEAGVPKSIPIKNYDVIGALSIPAIDIRLPVISQWSYPNLRAAPCLYSGSPDGQMIVLAHNYARHFGHIKDLAAGDTVEFKAVDGTVYSYQVIATEIVDGDKGLGDITSGSDWDLTLFTCTYGGASRVVVRCVKT